MNYFKFKKKLRKAWCKETAYHKDAHNWSLENPALGQCAISSLLFNEYFGGEIFSGVSENGIWHYWNKKYVIIDLTKSQFKEKLKFKNIRKWDRDELLKTGDVLERYTLLKNRFLSL